MNRMIMSVVALLVIATAWALCQPAPAQQVAAGCSGATYDCAGSVASTCSGATPLVVQRVTLFDRMRARRAVRQERRAVRRMPSVMYVTPITSGCGG